MFFNKHTSSSSSASSSKGSSKRFTLNFKRSSTSTSSTVEIGSSPPHLHTALPNYPHHHQEPFPNQIAQGGLPSLSPKRGAIPRSTQYQNNHEFINAHDTKPRGDATQQKPKARWLKAIRTIIRPKSRHTTTTINNDTPTPTKKGSKKSTKQTLMELQLRHGELEDAFKSVEEEYYQVETQNQEHQTTIKSLQGELNNAKEENAQVAGQVEEKEGQLVELKKKHVKAVGVLSAAKVEIEKGHTTVQEKDAAIKLLESRLEDQEKATASISALNRQLEESLVQQKKELEGQKEAVAREFQQYQDEQREVIRALEEERDAIRQEHLELISQHQKEMNKDRKRLSRQYIKEIDARDTAAAAQYEALEEQTNAVIATQAKEIEAKNERLRKLRERLGRIEEKHQRQLVEKNLIIKGLQHRHQEVEWKDRCNGLMEAMEQLEKILEEKDLIIDQLKGPQEDDGQSHDSARGADITIDGGDEVIKDFRDWMAEDSNFHRDKQILHSVRSNLAKIADLFAQADDENEHDADINEHESEVGENEPEDNDDGSQVGENDGFDDDEHNYEADAGEQEVSAGGLVSDESDPTLHEAIAAAAVEAAMKLLEI